MRVLFCRGCCRPGFSVSQFELLALRGDKALEIRLPERMIERRSKVGFHELDRFAEALNIDCVTNKV